MLVQEKIAQLTQQLEDMSPCIPMEEPDEVDTAGADDTIDSEDMQVCNTSIPTRRICSFVCIMLTCHASRHWRLQRKAVL